MVNAIEVENLVKEYKIDNYRKNRVIDNVSFSVKYGEFTSILGISGSGDNAIMMTVQ